MFWLNEFLKVINILLLKLSADICCISLFNLPHKYIFVVYSKYFTLAMDREFEIWRNTRVWHDIYMYSKYKTRGNSWLTELSVKTPERWNSSPGSVQRWQNPATSTSDVYYLTCYLIYLICTKTDTLLFYIGFLESWSVNHWRVIWFSNFAKLWPGHAVAIFFLVDSHPYICLISFHKFSRVSLITCSLTFILQIKSLHIMLEIKHFIWNLYRNWWNRNNHICVNLFPLLKFHYQWKWSQLSWIRDLIL